MRKFALVVPFLLTAALPAVTAANPPDIAATETLPDGLPAADDVRRVLDAHPKVVAWQGRVAAARAQARGLEKGPHELTLSGGMDRREVDREGRFSEYNATLSRAVRLPGKARLDREIGRFGVVAAENLAEDARHQIALQLNGYWWDWLGAAAQAEVDRQAVTNYERSLAALGRRVALRDAAQLDVDQAAAALAAARTLAEQSAGRATVARSRLAAQFPTLTLPEQAPNLPMPSQPPEGLEPLRDLVIANSHEIAATQAEAQRLSSKAERDRRDRIADPSVGVRVFSERGGAETGGGLVFSMPLGSGNRRAVADQSAAEAVAAQADLQAVRYAVTETADADLAEMRYRLRAWQQARKGLAAQMEALAKLRRGHQLGEVDLGDLLVGERLVHDAFRTETDARTEAMRATTRLRIDAHALWLDD